MSRRLQWLVLAVYAVLFVTAYFQQAGGWRVFVMITWAAAFAQGAYRLAKLRGATDA